MCMNVCLHVHMCDWCPQRSEEGIKSRLSGVRGGCGPPCGLWKPSMEPLPEQQVLLTAKLCSDISFFYFNK